MPRSHRWYHVGILSSIAIALIGLTAPTPAQPVDPALQAKVNLHRSVSRNNLRQMARAFNQFESVNTFMPAAAHCDANGKPLLSWRVLILPHIEQMQLYWAFRFDEPWDSPHNKQLLQYMPATYALPGYSKTGDTKTYYRAFVSDPRIPPRNGKRVDAALDLFRGVGIFFFSDGTSNTALIAEAAEAVEWTKPDELMFDPNTPIPPRLGNHYGDGARVAFADGSARVLKPDIAPTTLIGLITRNGGEVVNP